VKNSTFYAYIAPFVVFMLLLCLGDVMATLGWSNYFLAQPKYWIFPLQTVVCGGLVAFYWRRYEFKPPQGWFFASAIALLVLGLWLAPQELLKFPPRLDGFDPTLFPPGSLLYWGNLGMRFLRLAVVVPFLEEIFWRGFLLRYLIKEDFLSIPIGSFSWFSFGGVTLLFALAHWGPDFVPALLTGALFNWVAVRTRSLSSCVLAHAITNLLLGFYIMATRQWGFW
jgi:CAAX prenyl protease-like protein